MVTIAVVVSRVSHGHKGRGCRRKLSCLGSWSTIDGGGVRSEPWKKGGLSKCGRGRTEHRDREHGVPKSWQDSAVSRVLKVE